MISDRDISPIEDDYLLLDFAFSSDEILPELRLHYRTIGTPVRDRAGRVSNAVLIMHGTGGSGGGVPAPSVCGHAVRLGTASR